MEITRIYPQTIGIFLNTFCWINFYPKQWIFFSSIQFSKYVPFTEFPKTKSFGIAYYSLLFFKTFVKVTFLLEKLLNEWLDEIFLRWDTVWKFANFSPTTFCENSVKLTFSLNSYTVNQFDEKCLQWGKITVITTLWWEQISVISTVWYLHSTVWKLLEFSQTHF